MIQKENFAIQLESSSQDKAVVFYQISSFSEHDYTGITQKICTRLKTGNTLFI